MKPFSIQIEWSENPILNVLSRDYSERYTNQIPPITFNSFDQATAVCEAAAKFIDNSRVEDLPTRFGCYDKTKFIFEYGDTGYIWRFDITPSDTDVLKSMIDSLKNSIRLCKKTVKPFGEFEALLNLVDEIKAREELSNDQ